jgi:hypothetical protein
MNCAQFRAIKGAEPGRRDVELEEHLAGCPDCAAFAADLAALELRLAQALRIEVPSAPAPRLRPVLPFALAAAAMLATVILVGLYAAFPRESLAGAIASHARAEPGSWTATAPVDPAALNYVLTRARVALEPGGPEVRYAQSCWFRGEFVPHLVVEAEHGPVTVIVLPSLGVRIAERFDEQGYRGIIVPAPHGALAVLAQSGVAAADVDGVARTVAARLHYLD